MADGALPGRSRRWQSLTRENPSCPVDEASDRNKLSVQQAGDKNEYFTKSDLRVNIYPACADNICLAHCIYFGDPVEIEKQILEKRKLRGG